MQRCEDNVAARLNGNALQPLSDVSVTVTDDRTGLKATLYSDDGVTQISQPLVTDDNGYYGFYAANGEYTLSFTGLRIATFTRKVVLADPSDNPYASLAALAAGSGSSLVTFTQAGAGATPRGADFKLKEWVSPEDYGGTNSAAIQKAFDASPMVRFTPGVEYTITTPITRTGRVTVQATGATIKADATAFVFTDASFSRWDGGYLQEITVPYTIQRNTATWADNVVGDVIQSANGYQPSALDGDIYAGLSAGIKSQDIGPKIVFTCSTATGGNSVFVTGVTGRFVSIVLEGYSQSTVEKCALQGGRDYAGIVFYNGTNLRRIGATAQGFTFARGIGNKAVGNTINRPSICGVTFFGNDYWLADGNHVQGAGESGIKTYQQDTTFGSGVICWYGAAVNNTSVYNRFDGIDVSATYPTAGTASGHNRVENNTVIGNRSTGIFSDAQGNDYIGNKCLDNGLGGITIKAANCRVIGNHVEGNLKHPGITGAYSSYDLEVNGDNCYVAGNAVLRASGPAYTYAMYHNGSGGANMRNFVPNYDTFIAQTNLRNVTPDIYRTKRVPNAFVEYMITDEPASIQSILKMWRTASQGQAISFYQGASETSVGNISLTASATAYNTSSDYRLKNIYGPLTNSGAFIDSLKPLSGAWKVDGSPFVGFLAHEVQHVSPSSVTGEKDAVDENGKPVMQAMEYGSAEFIANIVAELQSLRRRVAYLEQA